MSRCPPSGSFERHKWWEGFCTMRGGFDRVSFRDAVVRYRLLLLARPHGAANWRAFKDGCRDGLDEHRSRV